MLLNETTTVQVVVHETPAWEDTRDLTLEEALRAAGRVQMGYESPLCRFGIVTEPSGTRHFLWLVHHAVFDGLGLGPVLETLDKAYRGQELPVVQPYSRFISYTMGIDTAAAAEYWRAQLRGARQASFPAPGRLSQVDATTAGTGLYKHIVPLAAQPAHVPGRVTSVTQATILRAAWAIVLARYCDSDDVCFGTTISGRQAPVPGLEHIAGPMIATVPVRIQVGTSARDGQDRTVGGFLQDVQNQALDMVAYEQFGLQNIAKVSRDAEEACNFSSLFLVQPAQMTAPATPSGAASGADGEDDTLLLATDLTAEGLSLGVQNYFSYPLVVQAHLHEHSAALHFIYKSKVLEETTLVAMAKQFDHVVQQLQSSLLLSAVSVAGPWDLAQAMHLNQETPELCQTTIHELVERQALARPAAPAIDAWDATFTYRHLNDAADRLTHHLATVFGVKVGDLVHVCFEKSAWYFVAILAINKAGAAWVPLEPSHPFERHQRVVQQTGATLALVSAGNVDVCANLVSTVLLVSSSLDEELAAATTTAGPVSRGSDRRAGPSDVAYVLFTSGSTGTPKGFVMEHGAVCTSQTAIGKRLGLEPEKVRILQFASYVFDLSIGEIVAPLISGACVCVPSEETRLGGLVEYINEAGVNWAFLTPAFARTLRPSQVTGLELLLLAGEAVGHDVFHQWFGHVRLINGWGPAETCVFSTLHEWTSADESPLTVGRPVGGYCWVVDTKDQALAPIGCLGEVYIQGPTLLREYIADRARTDATISRSLPDWAPMRSSPAWQRFYKSGDLCFVNSKGLLEFSGRRDDQVKIRGLRVELGEVEQAIRSALPAAQVAVEVHRADTSSSLVAFLCFPDALHARNPDEAAARASSRSDNLQNLFLPITEELRDDINAALGKLSITLPRYMIPSLFVPCRAMPLITSTKIDRAGLRRRAADLLSDPKTWDMYALQGSTKRKPQTAMEHRMQRLWAGILRKDVDSIGRDDSFLSIGGDSILSIHLVAKAREEGLKLTARSIFEDPRLLAVAANAHEVEKDRGVDTAVVEPFSLLPGPVRQAVADPSEVVEGQTLRQICQLSHGQTIEDAYPCTPLQVRPLTPTISLFLAVSPGPGAVVADPLACLGSTQKSTFLEGGHMDFRNTFQTTFRDMCDRPGDSDLWLTYLSNRKGSWL